MGKKIDLLNITAVLYTKPMENVSPELPTPFGKYLLLERLSSGGTAEVFLAKTREPDRRAGVVAIKRILPYLADNKEFSDRLSDEARIASSLIHPNVVRILELGREGRDLYLAMEFIRGKSLSKIFQALSHAKSRMPISLTVFIISSVLEGLAYAHQHTDAVGNPLRVVHQDITPKNIIISYGGEVKLIDFGMAKVKRVGRIFHSNSTGTVGYMSPEQLQGLPVDHRSDIYSLGIVLYELLTGTRLFSEKPGYSSIEQQRINGIELLSGHKGTIPKELIRVVMRALATEPDDRYETASPFEEELSTFLTSQGTHVNSEDLGAFIKSLFAEEIEHENRRFLTFDNI